jgi:Tfp pilus assembly protein PilO
MGKLIFGTIALIIAGGAFFAYTKPAYDGIQATQAQIAEYDSALSKAAELQSLKQSLLSRYNAFDPTALDRLQKMLPDHVDNIALILDLDSIASRYGLALQNVDIATAGTNTASQTAVGAIGSANQAYDSLTLTFSTSGTYDSFQKFMTDLENSLRIVDLSSLVISRASGSSGNAPVYTYNISLRTYWLK